MREDISVHYSVGIQKNEKKKKREEKRVKKAKTKKRTKKGSIRTAARRSEATQRTNTTSTYVCNLTQH